MEIKKENYGFYISLILLVVSYFFPIQTMLIGFLLLGIIILHRREYKVNKIEFLFLVLLYVGTVGYLFNGAVFRNYIKDFYYPMYTCFFYLLGKSMFRNQINAKQLFTSLICFTSFVCIYDIANIILKLPELVGLNINAFRSIVGTGLSIPVLSTYLLLFCENDIQITKRIRTIQLILHVLDILVHLSRTNIVLFMLMIYFGGQLKNSKKNLRLLVSTAILILIVTSMFPSLFSQLISKFSGSMSELGFRVETWTEYNVTNNWRGYELYRSTEVIKHSSIFELIFGHGMGYQLDVGSYAKLVTSEDGLQMLHNGYCTIILKYGLIGILICFYSFWTLFKLKYANDYKSLMKGIIAALAFATYVVMGPLYSLDLARWFFLIGGILAINENNRRILSL